MSVWQSECICVWVFCFAALILDGVLFVGQCLGNQRVIQYIILAHEGFSAVSPIVELTMP